MTDNKGVHNVYTILGASNHTYSERQNEDFYATDPIAIDRLKTACDIPLNIYEPCCGDGSLSKRLKELGHNVYSTDLINRGYGDETGIDFNEVTEIAEGYSILTNPPYSLAKEFVLKALDLVDVGQSVIMLLRLNFLEGKARRKEIFDKCPPKCVYVCSERLLCAKNADFKGMKKGGGSAVAYAWYEWKKGYIGDTVIKWI